MSKSALAFQLSPQDVLSSIKMKKTQLYKRRKTSVGLEQTGLWLLLMQSKGEELMWHRMQISAHRA